MKKLFISILVFSTLFLSGCYDSHEVDNMVYVLATGIDKGEEYKYSYTFQFALPLNISGGVETGFDTGENDTPLYCKTIEANSVYNAINILNEIISKEITLSHMKLIVFSNSVAADGLKNFKTGILSDKKLLPSTYVAVSEGDAEDYLKNVFSPLELNPARYYDLVFENKYSAFSQTTYLKDFYRNTDLTLPIVIGKDRQAYSMGCIMLDEDTSCGTIPPEEIPYYKLLRGTLSSVNLDFSGRNFIAKIKQERKPKLRVNPDTMSVNITVYISREIIPSGSNLTAEQDKIIKERVSRSCKNLLSKSQRDNCDILNIRDSFRPHFINLQEYNALELDKNYAKIDFNIFVVIV